MKNTIHLYGMDRKAFKSKLFNKKIETDNVNYWEFLYAEILFRLKMLNDLNCNCSFCFREKVNLKNTLERMEKDNHIKDNPKPNNFTGYGDCGRKLGPVA
jgi:hypothetical protein